MLTQKLIGDPQKVGLEKRLLNVALLTSILINSIFLLETIILGFSNIALTLVMAPIVIILVLYILNRRPEENNWIAIVFITIICSQVVIDWHLVGGVTGMAIPVFIAIVGMTPTITRKAQLLTASTIILILVIILSVGSLLFLDKFPLPKSTPQSVFEKIFESVILAAGLACITFIGVNAYRDERKRTLELNSQLLELNHELTSKHDELQIALQEIKTLQGVIPICGYCKNIRNDKGSWDQLEKYISDHTDARFSHGICPDCLAEVEPEVFEELKKEGYI